MLDLYHVTVRDVVMNTAGHLSLSFVQMKSSMHPRAFKLDRVKKKEHIVISVRTFEI